MAKRARLLSVLAPHAASWLSAAVPSPGLGLHLEPNKLHGHLSARRKP